MKNIKLPIRNGSAILLCVFVIMGLTSCGGANSEPQNSVSSGGAVSGQSVEEAHEKVKQKMISIEQQISLIAGSDSIWRMKGATEDNDSFSYALTDLDQDGYIEILTIQTRGTGRFTRYYIYEVDETGKGLTEWGIEQDTRVEEEGVAADFNEFPMEVYRDGRTGSYHYSSADFVHESAAKGMIYMVDMEIRDNVVRERIVTYMKSEFDVEEEDSQYKQNYFDAGGKRISEEESAAETAAYYEGMEKRHMFYSTRWFEAEEFDEMTQEEREWEIESSWDAFSIEKVKKDSEFEQSLSKDIRGQLMTMASDGAFVQYEDTDSTVYYAVTDLDRDGRLELIVSTIEGSGIFSYYNMYEVDAEGEKLVKWKQKIKGGESRADISNATKVNTYTDEVSGITYYLFADFIHVSGEESYRLPRSLYIKDNVVREDGPTEKDELEGMKKGTQKIGWQQEKGLDLCRMNLTFLYDQLVESWRIFCEKD